MYGNDQQNNINNGYSQNNMNQMNNGYSPNNMNQPGNIAPKNNNMKLIIIVGVIVLLAVVAIIFLLGNKKDENGGGNGSDNTNSGQTNNTTDNNNNTVATSTPSPTTSTNVSQDELKNNISISYETSEKGDIIAFIKNNGNVELNFTIRFHYYDKDGNEIQDDSIPESPAPGYTSKTYNAFVPGEEQVIKLYNKIRTNFDHVEVDWEQIVVNEPGSILGNFNDKIELVSKRDYKDSSNITNSEIVFKNNETTAAKYARDIEVNVLFYKNGKIYDYSKTVGSLNAGETFTVNAFIDNENFDDTKVYYHVSGYTD